MRLREKFLAEGLTELKRIALTVARVLDGGGKILLFGNGGSAADAQHIAAEFVNRFMLERPPLPAMALTTDSSVLTAIGNDFGFDQVFSKQIRALGAPKDAAWGISTSGHSPNVTQALKIAGEAGLTTIGFGGPPNAPMSRFCEHYLAISGAAVPRIQELHILLGHTVVDLADRTLFGELRSALPSKESG
jgi:D-sedoheptulose 7-phosphate isomerase